MFFPGHNWIITKYFVWKGSLTEYSTLYERTGSFIEELCANATFPTTQNLNVFMSL